MEKNKCDACTAGIGEGHDYDRLYESKRFPGKNLCLSCLGSELDPYWQGKKWQEFLNGKSDGSKPANDDPTPPQSEINRAIARFRKRNRHPYLA